MRVLFHGWEFPPQGGGVGSYMHNMALALTQTGHSAVVVTGKAKGEPAEKEHAYGVVYRAYAYDEIGSAAVKDRVLAIARNHHVDLIEGADHLGECAGLLEEKRRPPVLVKVHACQAIRVAWESHVYYRWQKWSLRLAHLRVFRQLLRERQSIERADLLAVPSRRIWDEMIRQGLRLPRHIGHIPNPFPFVHTLRDSCENPTPLVLFVGRIEFGKGIEFLPGIIHSVVRSFPDVRFMIAGSDTYARGLGSLRRWLEKEMGELTSHVDFLGRLDSKALNEVYGRSWLVIVPSRWDNFPTVMLEAMAKGRPIVTSPHGGMPEMLEGTGAIVTDPGKETFANAVCDLLGDSDERRKIGVACKQRVQEVYSPNAVVTKYVSFVQKKL
jgi:glycosyltransferase involved in cell wall biosynthesis